MTDDEKKAYIDAELCLMSKPAKIPLRGAKTMFDEFQALHVMQAELAHFVVRPFANALSESLPSSVGLQTYSGLVPYLAPCLHLGT